MAQKIRIKDIAEMAGVSPGTVDRVIHNRGNVAPDKLKAIEQVLKKVKYRPNIHISAISIKKSYNLVVTMPCFCTGEYWEIIQKGIRRAITEYESLNINCRFFLYDQFDLFSCRAMFEKVMKQHPDGVIIGPTFRDETTVLATWLEDKNIPYVYVDSMVDGTHPIAFFSADQFKCGYLISKLIDTIVPPGSEIALFQAVRIGDASANTTVLRKSGFLAYLNERDHADSLHRLSFSVMEPAKNRELIGDFFKKRPDVHGAVVLSSRGNVIADYFRENGIKEVRLICIDLTATNIKALRSGEIDFVIAQRPQQQGFLAVKALIEHLVYGQSMKVGNYMPLDILTRENLDFYSEFSNMADH